MSHKKIASKLKIEVKERAKYCCEYCLSQEKYSANTFSMEHIIAKAKGGTDDSENLANACQECNNYKFTHSEAIDPLTIEMAPLYHPRRDLWRDHFGWNEDYMLMIGLTPTGRATIERLNLNRDGVVNLRRVLHKLDLHPPY